MATVPTPPTDGSLPMWLDPAYWPNLDDLVTRDDTPVDNIYAEKQQRLLTEPLYSSWPGPGEGRTFLALANVGLFHKGKEPPLVPDGLLSLDVTAAEDLHAKENHSYFVWILGKPPDVVWEIVSDRRGGEESFKFRTYARMGVLVYVIYDPEDWLRGGPLRVFALLRGKYEPVEPGWLPEVGLGLTLWTGAYEGSRQTGLRWCDQQGRVIPTGAERAEEANEKVQRLIAQLKAHGLEPEA